MSPTTTPDRQVEQLQPLVAAQAQTRAGYTAQAVAIATSAAAAFHGWYDHDLITAWAATLAARIEALQRAQAASTDAYLARAISLMTGSRARPVGRVNVTDLRTGITHAGAYARAADVYRYQQSRLDQFTETLAQTDDPAALLPPDLATPADAAADRAAAVADMDIQLADRAQSHATLTGHAERREITGWRRVIHPELSKGGTCGLCIAASDQIYHVQDLRPLHARCECTTLPVIDEQDPGSGLNNLDLSTLYEHAGGSTSSRDLKHTRYSVNEHGELGPVLTDGKFRTPARVRKERQGARTLSPTDLRDTLQRRLAVELSAQGKAHQLATVDPGKWGRYAKALDARIADLQHQLAA